MSPKFWPFTINIKAIARLLVQNNYLFVLVFLVSFNLVQAQEAPTKTSFDTALYKLKKGASIGDYASFKKTPVYPYLLANYYLNHLDRDREIYNLIRDNQTASPVRVLYYRWIDKKHAEHKHSLIIDTYLDFGGQVEDCIYRNALLKTGREKEALAGFDSIWLEPELLPSACNGVVARWNKSTRYDYVMKKSINAYRAGKDKVLSSMLDQLNASDRKTFQMFLKYAKNPESLLVENPKILVKNKLKKQLLPRVLANLARIDSVKYTDFILQFDRYLYRDKAYQNMLSKLVLYVANRNSEKTELVYSKILKVDEDDENALLRYLIYKNDWMGILKKIPVKTKSEASIYWKGNAYAQTKNSSKAKKMYKKISGHRSYYGFLAADKLNKSYSFNKEKIKPNSSKQKAFSQSKTLKRVRYLRQLEQDHFARSEIIRLQKDFDTKTKQQFAYWLSQNHFYFESIYILGQIKSWNDIEIRFPLAFKNQVYQNQKDTLVHPTWAYAIIRQESTMNPKANSSVGARGLMQIMPKTATHLAKQENIKLTKNSLFDPKINIRLGISYLQELLLKFDDMVSATAAYNAGPTRVKKWGASTRHEAWVESIPFNETRKYVKNILEYQQVYAHLLGLKIPKVSDVIKNN